MSIEAAPPNRRRNILLTGGRAPCTLELARAFHAAGHRVLVAESARRHLCRVSRAVEQSFAVPPPNGETASFLEALEAIVTREGVDVLIPTCEEIFFVAKGLERLKRHCAVWAAPIEELGELHNKWRFAALARRLGLSVPETRLIANREEWLAYAEGQRSEESLVLKPVYSRFASRVLFLSSNDSAAQRRQILSRVMPDLSPEAPWVAQRRIEGRHLATYSIAYEGELVAHGAYPCRYRIGQGATVYFEPIRHEPSLEWVRKLVKAIGFTGQIAFDFIEEEGGGLYALECNPRATSGVHLFGGNAGLVQAFLQPEALRSAGVLVEPAGQAGSMLTVPMLAAGLSGIRSLRQLRGWAKDFHAARDAVFHRTDMGPAIEQLRVLREAWRTGKTHGISLTEATTIDLEWNGEP
ncbi:ATP-grasp domain-containing protein [Paenibacillus sp. YN15]|uniref:ATP-grasp domain-containing protein n=1 Tax=Paenibacillus sp. YN15 TaxID=1742774 RepID=UPI000DCD7ED6|nr:ATP-grasp domain-containing protein [Paenibacillus sp. YN15]RAV01956.1 ATP-grasp domain-containing protein [Paenibacillus sp. YN15]